MLPYRIIVKFTDINANKIIVSRLKEFNYNDLSKIMFNGLRCTFPYFIIDRKEKILFLLPTELNFRYKMYQSGVDLPAILQFITTRTVGDYVLDTCYSC